MAKKKSTHKSSYLDQDNHRTHDQSHTQKKQSQTQEKPKTLSLERQPTMEDASEKVQNLKNLNSMLLKETLERRQQVETLVHSKEALEAELTRSGVEKSELEGRLSVESDKNVSLEIEEGLFRFLVKTQMREMGVGFDREKCKREEEVRVLKGEVESERERLSEACRERDLVRRDFDCQVKELDMFRERLVEMERKEREFEDQVLMLKNVNEGLVKERNERKRDVEAVRKEKSLVERRLVETFKEIDDLKGEIEETAREKMEIERESSEQKVRIDELEKEVVRLNEVVLDLRREDKVLREKVLELEKSYGDTVEKGEEMAMMIDVLRGEKDGKERSIENLMREKEDVFLRLEMAIVEVNDKEGQIEKLIREKNEIEERKVSQESEIVGLHKEISELRNSVSALKELCRNQEEKSKQLVNEVTSYKNALDRAEIERDDAQKCLVEEKKNGLDLKLKLSEMEKKVGEKVEELAEIRNEHDNLVKEKKKMEERIGLLMMEKESVEKNLLEAQQGINEMGAKLESFGVKSDRALTMLKSTAALVCQPKHEVDGKAEVVVNERKLDGVTDPYAAELGVIENAFRSKEKLVEDMKQQLEFMKNSMAEANKKKSFWTVVSSATALFAAASVAYAARIR